MARDRQRYIMRKLEADGSVTTLELSRALHVSAESIRRDLISLEQQSLLKRVYGGAVSLSTNRGTEPPFRQRLGLQAEAKVRIGRIAAELAAGAHSIFIDVGTTASAVAGALPKDCDATIATHSLLVAKPLVDAQHAEVLLAPGRLRRGEWSLTGASTLKFLAHMYFDVAFLSCGGVDAKVGATDFNFDDVEVKKTVARNSKHVYVLADASKHLVVGTYEIASWFDVTGLITDAAPPEGIVNAIRTAGGRIFDGRHRR